MISWKKDIAIHLTPVLEVVYAQSVSSTYASIIGLLLPAVSESLIVVFIATSQLHGIGHGMGAVPPRPPRVNEKN